MVSSVLKSALIHAKNMLAKAVPVKAVTNIKYQYSSNAYLSAFSMLLEVPSKKASHLKTCGKKLKNNVYMRPLKGPASLDKARYV
jgi:hypothetical protein